MCACQGALFEFSIKNYFNILLCLKLHLEFVFDLSRLAVTGEFSLKKISLCPYHAPSPPHFKIEFSSGLYVFMKSNVLKKTPTFSHREKISFSPAWDDKFWFLLVCNINTPPVACVKTDSIRVKSNVQSRFDHRLF